jgi:hypothetical protein
MSDWSCPKCNLRSGQTCSDRDCPGLAKAMGQAFRMNPLPDPALRGISGAMGCICPPTSEQTCQGPLCPRRNHLREVRDD